MTVNMNNLKFFHNYNLSFSFNLNRFTRKCKTRNCDSKSSKLCFHSYLVHKQNLFRFEETWRKCSEVWRHLSLYYKIVRTEFTLNFSKAFKDNQKNHLFEAVVEVQKAKRNEVAQTTFSLETWNILIRKMTRLCGNR